MYAFNSPAAGMKPRFRVRRRERRGWNSLGVRVAISVLVVGLFLLAFARVAEGATEGPYESMTVQPGDTLWSIASARYPGIDVRSKIFQIEQLNHLEGPTIAAGESLRVPSR